MCREAARGPLRDVVQRPPRRCGPGPWRYSLPPPFHGAQQKDGSEPLSLAPGGSGATREMTGSARGALWEM